VIPDLSTAWVIAFVLVLSVLLDRLLLRPVTRVMRERQGAIRTAGDLAEAARARAQAGAGELEARTRAARGDVYRQMDEKRRVALEHRAELLAGTRREVEQLITNATARVRSQAGAARAELDRDADAIASTIVERVLGRNAS
jgi:F0F1-type ATP synthase membrane subunit b/b'